MKLIIASDIHGSEYWCKKLLERFEAENADKLLILGDILYHGPRNNLPLGYNPKGVISLLNPVADRLICVRGNCDSEVDQMVLSFPIMAEYAFISIDGIEIIATHGHTYCDGNPPPHTKGTVLLCGHTHIPKLSEHETYAYINPGSVSIPKEGSANGYIVLENGVFTWKDMDGSDYMTYQANQC